MITIKVSYETMLKRIEKRGRDYELVEKDPSLEDYYHRLLNCYEVWMKEYKASPLLVIDGDKYDFVDSLSDRVEVFDMIESKLHELGNLNDVQMDKFKAEHEKIFKAQ